MFKKPDIKLYGVLRPAVFFLLLSLVQGSLKSQTTSPSVREAKFMQAAAKMVYPLINAGPMSGVLPVAGVTSKPDTKTEARLIFDFTQSTPAAGQAEQINPGLLEVARVLNLHAAAGYPPEKIKSVIIFHSGSILSLMNQPYYQSNYQKANPNQDLLEQLRKAGATLVVCGQSLALRDFSNTQLLQGIEVAVSAKTTLTKYHQAGYQTFEIKSE